MKLRLTVIPHGSARVVIHVDGRLAGEGVADVEQACRQGSAATSLDLANLLSVDDTGIATLRKLAREGVQLMNPSPYVALLLGAMPTAHVTRRGGGPLETPSKLRRKHR